MLQNLSSAAVVIGALEVKLGLNLYWIQHRIQWYTVIQSVFVLSKRK